MVNLLKIFLREIVNKEDYTTVFLVIYQNRTFMNLSKLKFHYIEKFFSPLAILSLLRNITSIGLF